MIQTGIHSVEQQNRQSMLPDVESLSYNSVYIFRFVASNVPIYIYSNTALFTQEITHQF